MPSYEELDITPMINANATLTRLGGSIMPPEVREAMMEAAKSFIDLPELQRRVGNRIALLTQNEACYVSSGAAGGIVVAIAACVTGNEAWAIEQLPDLTGLKNEVIVHKSQRNGYDHAVRQVGVKLIEIGWPGQAELWHLERAINEKTAAVIWFEGALGSPGDIPLEKVIDTAHAHGVPVLVDAAAQLPPVENLWKFTQMGADAAIFSGGKDLRGPQSSGLVLGKQWLIDACALNGPPHHNIGRPMKVGKEEMVGLLAAVERYLSLDHEARNSQMEEIVAGWCSELNRLDGVTATRSFPSEANQPMPRTCVRIDASVVGRTYSEILQGMRDGTPSVNAASGPDETIMLNPQTLEEGEEEIVLARLVEEIQR